MKTTPKKPVQQRNKYTPEDKANARKYYLMGLTLPEIGLLLGGCPVRTLEKWQSSEQWTRFKQLKNIETKVCELHASGHSYKQIAEMLDISTVTVWRYLRKVRAVNAE